MQAELLSLRLFANGLYILESHGYLNIPTTIITFSTQMNDLIDRLSLFKVKLNPFNTIYHTNNSALNYSGIVITSKNRIRCSKSKVTGR